VKPTPEDLDPENWLDAHGDILYRYALSRVRNHATAEDLVQDTLLAGVKSVDRFTGASTLRTWLVSILKHKIIDYMRKSKREFSTDDETMGDWAGEEYFDRKGRWKKRPPEWISNPGKAYEREEFWGVLQGCLGKLKEKQHTAFVLRELEGMDSTAICDQLEISPSNLYILMFRARLALRKCLESNWLDKNETDLSF